MLNYVTNVFVSNLASGAVVTSVPSATTTDEPSANAGKFIFMQIGNDGAENIVASASDMADADIIKMGIITKKNNIQIDPQTKAVKYVPVIKWSNIIKKADIKRYTKRDYEADTEDKVYIDFNDLSADVLNILNDGGKRIIVRLTFKDLPTRFRKWTESYEYVTKSGDTKATIASNIATLISKQWKRARIYTKVGNVTYGNDGKFASFTEAANGTAIEFEAMKYTDDNVVDSLNWANKVRFNANIYFTDPSADGWDSTNKNYPTGVKINKVPGKTYIASAKLVRDREAWAMGYEGILNRGEGTWPIVKPDMETVLSNHYDAITLEFENMYRAADDIQRKTKQVVEIYAVDTTAVASYLDAFVNGEAGTEDTEGND